MTINKFEKELLIAHYLKTTRAHIIAHPELLALHENNELIKRREKGEPIAYITGEKEFFSLVFKVNPHVLIPRPETELLIEIMLEKFDQHKAWRFLELGTGSGAIAITLAKHFPHSQIVAVDISEGALMIAQENKQKHQVENVKFKKSNWFSTISGKFDAIISNPPYIPENDPHILNGDLRFEPLIALTSGQSGLEAISKIIQESKKYLLPEGYVLLEHGYDQARAIQNIFREHKFSHITLKNDLQQLPRVTFATL